MAALKAKKESLLKQYKVPEWYLDLQYNCNTCKDRGFLKNGHKCNCLKQEIINDSYKMSNLSKVLDSQNFSTLDTSIFSKEKLPGSNISPYENILEIVSICELFIMDFNKDNGENLLFYGDTGLGKTFMCNCIAKELLDRGHLVIYQTAFKMFEIIEDYKFKNADSHISKDNYENLFDCDLLIIDDLGHLVIYQTAFKMFEIIEDYKFKNADSHISKDNYENLFDCDLLIIDDLGTELTNSFTNSELFNIINTRLLSGKKTIISTNLSPMQLGNDYAQRIFSRIFDRFKMVKFIGRDLRWENRK